MILQMSNSKLREKALSENVTYEELIKLGITKEQSEKGAALLEQASGHSTSRNVEEEFRRLKIENRKLKEGAGDTHEGGGRDELCPRCGLTTCPQGHKCPANGQKCSKCGKMNHYARACCSKAPKQRRAGKPHRPSNRV